MSANPEPKAQPSAQEPRPASNPPRGGRPASILAAFLANQASLRGFISRFMISAHEIEDVSQETFLRAYKAEQQRTIDQPKAYLFRVAKNILLNDLNNTSRKATDYVDDLESLDVLDSSDTLEANVMAQQRLGIYCEAIAALPKQCRRVMLMKKVYGLPTKEVARRLNISVSTVEKHMTKGLKDCNAVLAERYRDLDSDAALVAGKARSGHAAGRKS